jgi:hypothetical protein
MDWRSSSSSRAAAVQGQSPEFKPQYYKKRKKNKASLRYGIPSPHKIPLGSFQNGKEKEKESTFYM